MRRFFTSLTQRADDHFEVDAELMRACDELACSSRQMAAGFLPRSVGEEAVALQYALVAHNALPLRPVDAEGTLKVSQTEWQVQHGLIKASRALCHGLQRYMISSVPDKEALFIRFQPFQAMVRDCRIDEIEHAAQIAFSPVKPTTPSTVQASKVQHG